MQTSALAFLFVLFGFGSLMGQQWVVEFSDSKQASTFLEAKSNSIHSNKKLASSAPIYRLDLKNEDLLMDWHNHPSILHATPNYKTEDRSQPNDPFYDDQWNMKIIEAEPAWNEANNGMTVDGQEIVIAVLDSKIDINHTDLINNIWRNEAEIPNDGIDNDNNGYVDDYFGLHVDESTDTHPVGQHGTNVAGIIGAEGNNNLGVAGINWNIKLMIISGANNVADIVEGYNYVLDQRKLYNESNGEQGAFVVATNFSAGIPNAFGTDFPLWCNMYDKLGEEGIISVCAVDNDEYNVDTEGDMPTTCSSNFLIAVTGTDRFDNKTSGSAFGPVNVDIGAPGMSVMTTDLESGYREFGGTSAACPHVSGTIGLLYAVECTLLLDEAKTNPVMAAQRIKQAILNNVDILPDLTGSTSSNGRLSAFDAMNGLTDFCSDKGTDTREKLIIETIGPNPTDDYINLTYGIRDFTEHNVSIYNSIGQLILVQSVTPSLFSAPFTRINVNHLTQGMYILTITDGEELVSWKFWKKPI